MAEPEIKLQVFRDLANQAAGEPDDGPMAMAAHRERARALEEALDGEVYAVRDWGDALDRDRPHEFAELAVRLVGAPQAARAGAAGYAGALLAGETDARIGAAASDLLDRLLAAFRARRIGDFRIILPDGAAVRMDPDAHMTITLPDGRMVGFHSDAPPEDGAPT